MAVFETWLETDLTHLPNVTDLPDDTFTMDSLANKINVRVTKNKQPCTLTGTIRANIIRPDGQTISASGTKNGNIASVTLPNTVYTAPGLIKIAVKLIDGENVTTLAACQCVMHRAMTEVTI